MNKKHMILCGVLVCVILAALILSTCGKTEVSKAKPVTNEAAVTVAAGESLNGTDDGSDVQEQASQAEDTAATEETVKMTDPVTGETIDAKVDMGVEEGEYIPDLEEDEETTVPSKPVEVTKPTAPIKPEEVTKPTAPVNPALPQGQSIRDITYEMYMNMTGAEQEAVIAQFGSINDFMVWFNAVKAVYEAEHPNIEVGGDTAIDGSQIKN